MLFRAKVELYHNTKGLIAEGQDVDFDFAEIKEYDPQYFKDLFERADGGDIDDVVANAEDVQAETTAEDAPTEKPKRGRKAE